MIDELPFLIQRHIMEYRPRLPYFPKKEIILGHLNKKYCKTCGEYIDMPYYKHRPAPIHLHQGRKKYTQARFISISPTTDEIMPYNTSARKKRVSHKYAFHNARIIFRVRQPRFFYNMRCVLRPASGRMILMENTAVMNIFCNPDFILIHEPHIMSNTYTQVKGVTLNGAEHRNNILNVFVHLSKDWHGFLRDCIDTNLFLDYEYLLKGLVQQIPELIVTCLMYVCGYPDFVYKKIIGQNIDNLKYFTEEKLIDLFARDPDFFFDLFIDDPRAIEYFYFDVVDAISDI